MSPVETIAAAIEKLEKQKAAATPGPWNLHFADEFTARVGIDHSSRPTSLTGTMQRTNADLIVTLHRSIDPQLAILRAEAQLLDLGFREGDNGSLSSAALDLARAILGEAAA